MAGVLALLPLLLLLRLDELASDPEGLDDLEDAALWVCAGLDDALSVIAAGVLPEDAALWVCAGLDDALSVVAAGVLPEDAALWVCAGLEAALSVEVAGALLKVPVL